MSIPSPGPRGSGGGGGGDPVSWNLAEEAAPTFLQRGGVKEEAVL